jgi:ketosteroid isomerase-like protein
VTDDFWEFIELRKQAAAAYVDGDPLPLFQILRSTSPASLFSSKGGIIEGADNVVARYRSDLTLLKTAPQADLEILHADTSGQLAYWVGFQHAIVRLPGQPQPVIVRLRVTEIFSKDDGSWKLIHRHEDRHAD